MNNFNNINIGSIEDAIKRCEQLIKPEHACWIGISNQLAILHILEDYRMLREIDKEHKKENGLLREKVKELEEKNKELWNEYHNRVQEKIDLSQKLEETIPKQKIKEIIDECIPKKPNIITGEIEYTPNTNANSYLTQQILELL